MAISYHHNIKGARSISLKIKKFNLFKTIDLARLILC
jgi:hypothetical protein